MAIDKQAIRDYIEKGPRHFQAHLEEYISDIQSLCKAMDMLALEDPITMVIGGLSVKLVVHSEFLNKDVYVFQLKGDRQKSSKSDEKS